MSIYTSGDVLTSAVIIGPATEQITLGPLATGSYPFECVVHPTMTGSIEVR